MRIIPKNTKIKMQLYKNIGIADVIIGFIGLGLIALTLSSNLPNKFTFATIILMIVVPLYIPTSSGKVYNSIIFGFNYFISNKHFYRNKKGSLNIGSVIPYSKIENDIIKQKDGSFTGVIEIMPIDFNMLSESRQNFLIDGVISNTLKNVGIMPNSKKLYIISP